MSRRERRRKRTRLAAGAGLSIGAALGASATADAATFTVTNKDDSGSGSLRQAVLDANAAAGADDVVFDSSLSGSIFLTGAGIPISQALTITGPGADELAIDAYYGTGRIFTIDPAVAGDPVSISGLTMAYGLVSGSGGAIINDDAKLTISDSLFFGNLAATGGIAGAAIADVGNYANGTQTTIDSSTIVANYAVNGSAGAIGVGNQLGTIKNSTIAANYAYTDGGGVVSVDGGGSLQNTTLSGNYAYDDGGGLVTITGGSTTQLDNSIIAGNAAGDSGDDLAGPDPFNAQFSLIQNTTGVTINETVTDSNLIGMNPRLSDYLTNSGGTTPTVLPDFDSPVIDQGKAAGGATTDQRGQTRPFDIPTITNSAATGADGADMGAVEATTDETTPVDLEVGVTDSPDPVPSGGTLNFAFQVTNNGPEDGHDADLFVSIPTELSYNDGASDPACGVFNSSVTGTTVLCDFGDLTNGQSATKNVVVNPLEVASAFPYISTYGYVDGPQADPDLNNNVAYADTVVTPPPATGTPAPPPSTSNTVAAAIKKCKKKFRGKKRKKCIKKARKKGAAAALARGGDELPQHPFLVRRRPPALEHMSLRERRGIWGSR